MHKKRELGCLLLVLGTAPFLLAAQPDERQRQAELLLERVRTGEARQRDDLVRDALTRLQQLAPDSAEGQLAALRLALREQDGARAEQWLQRLRAAAPNSPQLHQGEALLRLSQPQGQQQLQQARLLGAAGRRDEALVAYDALFAGHPPSLELALEYWQQRGAVDGQRPLAITYLQALDRQYPGSAALRRQLASLLFAESRDDEAIQVLRRMGSDPAARAAAMQREFDQLRERAPSRASAAAWQSSSNTTPMRRSAPRRAPNCNASAPCWPIPAGRLASAAKRCSKPDATPRRRPSCRPPCAPFPRMAAGTARWGWRRSALASARPPNGRCATRCAGTRTAGASTSGRTCRPATVTG